jgi:hypothetical protein
MLHQYFHTFIPVFGLLVNIYFQIAGVRCFKRGLSLLKSVFLGFIAGGISVIVFETFLFASLQMTFGDIVASLVTNLTMYAALGYGYFHFINLGETARRIRILRELYEARKGLAADEILSRYNARRIVTMRIGRLLRNGQIVERAGRYVVDKPLVLMMAKGVILLKRFLLGKTSEFDA